MDLSLEVLKQKMEIALKKLSGQDLFLIQANTNERTISHKLAEYLQDEFSDWNVDCEYNRHGNEVKRIELPTNNINWDDTEAKTVFPDIVVHKRNSDRNNLLIIEIKKSSNTMNRQFDENKLKAFTKEPYSYLFGLFLEISTDSTGYSLTWSDKGGIIDKQRIQL